MIVPKRQGRYELLKLNKAVYASPENIEEFAKKDDGRDLPVTISAVSITEQQQGTVRILGGKGSARERGKKRGGEGSVRLYRKI